MQKPKKSTVLASAAVALGLAAVSAGAIKAASSGPDGNPMSGLVTAIAQKFNLNTADVQQVFDEQRAQMDAQRQQEYKDRLAQAVTDGKLTHDQADKIVAKQQELESQRHANRTAMEGKTEEGRRATMKTEMDALQQWATDNNIPMEYLRFGGPGFGHGGPHGPGFGPGSARSSKSDNSSMTSN